GVVDLRDESDREGMRVVLELKRDAVEDVVLNQLYHHTQMEQTFGVINLALVDGEPKVLTLKEVLQSHVDHRVMIVRRRTEFDLRKARERLHIVEGLITAGDHLLAIIKAELLAMKEEYGDERRTKVEAEAFDMEIEDLIPDEHVVVPITNTGYIKRVPSQMYHTQGRGGKGVTGMETKEED